MRRHMKQEAVTFMRMRQWFCLAAALLVCLLAAGTKAFAADKTVPIDEEHFKDATFRSLVSEKFDDGDGILSWTEILNAQVLDCSSMEITSMEGIQYLTSLKELYCSDCSLTELNLEKNTSLEKLDCSGNGLTKLDIAPCTKLKVVYAQGNQISTLEIWGATYLRAAFNSTATDQGTYILYKKMSFELCVDKTVQIISDSYGVLARAMIKEGDKYSEPGSFSVGDLYPEGIQNGNRYGEGTTMELTAVAREGYEFAFWRIPNGEIVSSEATYSFDVTDNIDLWAVFVAEASYHAGDEFECQGYYFYDDCYDRVEQATRNMTVIKPERHSASYEYWCVGSLGSSYLYVNTPENRGILDEPAGFRIVSGDGTSENPYHLKLVYDNMAPEETGAVTIGTTWYRGKTVTSYAYFKGIDFTGASIMPKYTEGRLGTTSDIVTTFYHEFANNDDVIGVKVTSGEGTKENPYRVSAVYSQEWLESNNIPDLMGKEWTVGDVMELGDAYYYSYFAGDPGTSGHTPTVKTGELNGKTIGEPVWRKNNYGDIWSFTNIPIDGVFATSNTVVLYGIKVTGGTGFPDSPYKFRSIWKTYEGDLAFPGDFTPGDEFECKGCYFYDDCYDRVEQATSNMTVRKPERHSTSPEYWDIGNIGSSYLYVNTPENRGILDEPAGFRIASGDGTSEKPYHLTLVYKNVAPEETGTVTIGTTWYRGETVTSYAYFKGIDFTGASIQPKYTQGRLGTTSDVVTVFYHEFADNDDVIGVKVTSGEGTKDNPYSVSVVYSPEWLESNNIPDLMGKEWTVGDVMELGDAYYYSYFAGDPITSGHTPTVKTGELNGKTIGEPVWKKNNYGDIWSFTNIPIDGVFATNNTEELYGIKVTGGTGFPDSPYKFRSIWKTYEGDVIFPGDFTPGDEFECKGCYFYDDCYDRVEQATSNMTVIKPERHSASYEYWNVGKIGSSYLYVNTPENRGILDEPAGFRIASGDGTSENPYHLKLVYKTAPEETGAVTIGTTWYRGETVTSYAYFKGIDFTGPSILPKYTEGRLGTTSDVVTVFYRKFAGNDDVIGVKVTSGEGTKDNPYSVSAVYSQEWLESNNIPDLLGKEWTVGDVMELGDAYYYSYFAGDPITYGHDPTVKTGELNGKTIGEPVLKTNNYGDNIWSFTNIPIEGVCAMSKAHSLSGIKVTGGTGFPDSPYKFSGIWDVKPLTGTVNLLDNASGSVVTEAKYGQTLKAAYSEETAGYLYYRWTRDGENIDGATARTYKLTAEDIGKVIGCRVTCSIETGSVFSALSKPVGAESEGEDASLALNNVNVVLQNNLALQFFSPMSLYTEKGYGKPYIVFNVNGKEKTVQATEDGTNYVFICNNIAPQMIGDRIGFTIYAMKGTQRVKGMSAAYSVKDYCDYVLQYMSSDVKLRTLIVDLLNYGAATQTYANYKTDALVNKDLTTTQQGWATDEREYVYSAALTNVDAADLSGVSITNMSLVLNETVAIRYFFTATSISGLTLEIKDDRGQTWTLGESDFVKESDNNYHVDFRKLQACRMSDVVYATFHKGSQKSFTAVYSIESYASIIPQYTSDQKLLNLISCMMKYGDAAKAYKN